MSAWAGRGALVAHHAAVLERNLHLLQRFAEGVDEAASRLRVIPGGSHLAWLLAHLVATRDVMLRLADVDGVWDAETGARFGRGSDAGAPEYPPLPELLALLEEQQGRLTVALEGFAALADDAEAPAAGTLERLEFLVWHETYHLGQALLYRRAAGLPSPIG
jgi:hypothetical protein